MLSRDFIGKEIIPADKISRHRNQFTCSNVQTKSKIGNASTVEIFCSFQNVTLKKGRYFSHIQRSRRGMFKSQIDCSISLLFLSSEQQLVVPNINWSTTKIIRKNRAKSAEKCIERSQDILGKFDVV